MKFIQEVAFTAALGLARLHMDAGSYSDAASLYKRVFPKVRAWSAESPLRLQSAIDFWGCQFRLGILRERDVSLLKEVLPGWADPDRREVLAQLRGDQYYAFIILAVHYYYDEQDLRSTRRMIEAVLPWMVPPADVAAVFTKLKSDSPQ